MSNRNYLKGFPFKVEFEPSDTQLFVVLISGIIILVAGLYLFITNTEATAGSLPMHLYKTHQMHAPNLSGTFTILLGSIIAAIAIYNLIKNKRKKRMLSSEC